LLVAKLVLVSLSTDSFSVFCQMMFEVGFVCG